MFKLGDKKDIQNKIDSLYHFDCDYNGGDVITDTSHYPIMWTFAAINTSFNKRDKITHSTFTLTHHIINFVYLFYLS